MKLTNIIQRLRNQAADSEEQRSSAAKHNSNSEAPNNDRHDDSEENLDRALDEFRVIQELLQSSDETVSIPCEALLVNLPEKLRGEKYDANHYPDVALHIDRIELLEQLERGKAIFPLHVFAGELPEGWVQTNGSTETVELSLAEVVAAVPADLLQASATPSKAAQEVAFMQDYFTPKNDISGKTATPKDKAVPERVQPRRQPQSRPEKTFEPAVQLPLWEGIERSLSSAPNGLDLNSVSIARLEKLVGVGPVRAEAIIKYRQLHGRFESIFDLGKVPGIGPATFQQMTGLSIRTRRKRHEKLNQLLGLATGMDQISLAEIAEALTKKMSATGAVITNGEGMCLAATGEAADDAMYYAAVGAQFVNRTAKYTDRLTAGGAQCVVLPAGNPPLMVLSGKNAVFILTLKRRRSVSPQRLHKAIAVAQEVQWLLGPRAIVQSL